MKLQCSLFSVLDLGELFLPELIGKFLADCDGIVLGVLAGNSLDENRTLLEVDFNIIESCHTNCNCRSPDFKGPMGPTKIWRGTIIGWLFGCLVVRLFATLGPAGYNRLIPF